MVYHELARNLADGVGYKAGGQWHTVYAPGYPFLLSLFYRVFGASVWVAYGLNAVCTAASATFVALATRHVAAERSDELGAGAGCAFWLLACLPATYGYVLTLNAESVVLFGVSLLCWQLASRPHLARAVVACSAVIGALGLTKPEFFLWGVLPVASVALGVLHRDGLPAALRSSKVWRTAALTGAVLVLCLAPWLARNSALCGRVVTAPTSSSGATIWLTMHEPQLFSFDGNPDQVAAAQTCAEQGGPDPFLVDACMRGEAKHQFRMHPGASLRHVMRNIPTLFSGSHTEVFALPVRASFGEALHARRWGVVVTKVLSLAVHVGFFALGFYGLWQRRGSSQIQVFLLALVSVCGMYGVVVATPRYALHVAPIFALAAGLALSTNPWLRRVAALRP